MAADITDKFSKIISGTTRPVATTLSAQKLSGATTASLTAATGWDTDTAVHGIMYRTDAGTGAKVAGSQIDWKATLSGTTLSNFTVTAGTDDTYAIGATVELAPTAAWGDDLVTGLLVEHNQNGTHNDVTADTVTATTITADEFVVAGASANNGWTVGLPTPDTVTYNGNRSYDLVFNGTDLTDTISNGMRTRFTRTVSPPTQCTDLESSSSQYWSKTSPAGISFTTTFTCAAWVKLESYTVGGIIARRNADTEGWSLSIGSDGTVTMLGLRIAGNNKRVTSYQSLPLNKWVHVAACLDMTVGDTTAQKIWIDGVEVPRAYSLTGTATAIVQGTTALVVGAVKSDGSNPFDGKIAQASVHSACLSDAQIKAMASQTISSSTPSIVSGFTMNGVATDVTANANDLTASGGATYGTDSPFNSTEYGIITANSFSTNTTLTAQVPEGYAIPTSGGVSAVAYSTQSVPYGFPRNKGKWSVISFYESLDQRTSSPTAEAWVNSKVGVTVPTGAWTVGYMVGTLCIRTSTGKTGIATTLSTGSATETIVELSGVSALTMAVATADNSLFNQINKEHSISNTTAQTMYLNYEAINSGMFSAGLYNDSASSSIVYAHLDYL